MPDEKKVIDVREALENGEELPDEGGDVWAEPGPQRHKYYILDGRTVVPVNVVEWASWFSKNGNERNVALDFVGDHRVSTVFLGVDHCFEGEGPPLIFETMIFADGWDEQECWRCSTYEEAERQHTKAYVRLKAKYWTDGKLH